jgi:23S rRNA (guanosine2251-2'-O)-methyltransferase
MKPHKTYIYGKHAVHEALLHKREAIRRVYTTPSFQNEPLTALFAKNNIVPKNVTNALGNHEGVAHQGVFAEIDTDKVLTDYKTFLDGLKPTEKTSLVLLDEVQDPHNVGAIIRSAAGFGISGILMPGRSQAGITGAVIKVSAGMVFRIPIIRIKNVNDTLSDLKKRGFWIYGLMGEGDHSLHTEVFDAPAVFVMGNEGKGIRQKTGELCDMQLSIPIHSQCESLNVAASTAVVLYEWSRQHPDTL